MIDSNTANVLVLQRRFAESLAIAEQIGREQHRDDGGPRRLVVTVWGEEESAAGETVDSGR